MIIAKIMAVIKNHISVINGLKKKRNTIVGIKLNNDLNKLLKGNTKLIFVSFLTK